MQWIQAHGIWKSEELKPRTAISIIFSNNGIFKAKLRNKCERGGNIFNV